MSDPLVTAYSVDPELFTEEVNPDFLCGICRRVPRRPVNPKCCGQICCKECLMRWITQNPTCPFCRAPCTVSEVLPSPFIATKLSGLTSRCPNHRGVSPSLLSLSATTPLPRTMETTTLGCSVRILFGKEGCLLTEHMARCEYAIFACSDCGKSMPAWELKASHKPGVAACPMKRIPCDACRTVILQSEFIAHERSPDHQANVMRQCCALSGDVKKLSEALAVSNAQLAEQKAAHEATKTQMRTLAREVDDKFSEADTRTDQKIRELASHVTAEFCEFEISKWSEVKEAALFSTATPLRAWCHEWWLKVEKATDRIGLYLCIGEDGRFPVTVDYQLMCRRRSNDDGVCASVVHRTDFGKEKAWGVSKFSTIEQLEKEGAYSRAEDKIAFGCLIFPIRNLRWGRQYPRRRAAAT